MLLCTHVHWQLNTLSSAPVGRLLDNAGSLPSLDDSQLAVLFCYDMGLLNERLAFPL